MQNEKGKNNVPRPRFVVEKVMCPDCAFCEPVKSDVIGQWVARCFLLPPSPLALVGQNAMGRPIVQVQNVNPMVSAESFCFSGVKRNDATD